jgi:hypothetical protein
MCTKVYHMAMWTSSSASSVGRGGGRPLDFDLFGLLEKKILQNLMA